MPTIAAIIFDMDGVLVDSEHFICEAACRMFEQVYHQKVSPSDFTPFVGTGEDRYLGGVAEKYGLKLQMPRDKERTYAIYLDAIKGRLQPLPGAVQFVADGRRRGLKLAVASSADRIKVEGNLKEIGISLDSFDTIVTGDDVQRKKPDPQIFQLAATRLMMDPAKCLVVEDAISGVTAAKAAKCLCLALTTSFDSASLKTAGADFVAADLAHVPSTILDT